MDIKITMLLHTPWSVKVANTSGSQYKRSWPKYNLARTRHLESRDSCVCRRVDFVCFQHMVGWCRTCTMVASCCSCWRVCCAQHWLLAGLSIMVWISVDSGACDSTFAWCPNSPLIIQYSSWHINTPSIDIPRNFNGPHTRCGYCSWSDKCHESYLQQPMCYSLDSYWRRLQLSLLRFICRYAVYYFRNKITWSLGAILIPSCTSRILWKRYHETIFYMADW